MSADQELRPGLYRHYKGKMYRVTGIARHSETLEELAVYECLYDNDLGRHWVRPKKMFLEKVQTAEGLVPRFAFVPN